MELALQIHEERKFQRSQHCEFHKAYFVFFVQASTNSMDRTSEKWISPTESILLPNASLRKQTLGYFFGQRALKLIVK